MSVNPASFVERAPSERERHDIVKVTRADVPAVAEVMARAFFDDPVVGDWCFADETKRMSRLERFFELFLQRVYLTHDECHTTHELLGGAFWLPPGTWKMGAFAELRLIARMATFTRGATPRILQALNTIEAKHPHEPHYYLQFAGVEPDRQGHGIGSKLLRPVLERCDDDGVPAYLEATCERNAALYERHGFALLEQVSLPKGGPPLWRMWREPQAT